MRPMMVTVFAGVLLGLGVVGAAANRQTSPHHDAHELLDSLTPVAGASHRAVASGPWSDPSTWSGGRPTAGARVLIPYGIVVVLDAVSEPIEWIRIDGRLAFDVDRDTELTAESVIVGHSGHLTIGTRVEAVRAERTATLTIRSNGHAIDPISDPMQASRGLVSLGRVEMHGAAKTSWVALSRLPLDGALWIDVDTIPHGWRAGDEIVLTGTAYGQDETFRLTAVVERRIHLDRPVRHARAFPVTSTGEAVPGLQLHLANFTRNVTIRTDPRYAGQVLHHGHVMLMHRGGHAIRWAEFRDLGRTTIDPVTDPLVLPDRSRDPGLCPAGGIPAENVRGRYALHFHMARPDSEPSVVEGIAISVPRTARLKIGLANHSSNVEVRESVSHNVAGSHFFTEEGDEVGSFVGNLAIHSEGGNWRNELAPRDTLVKRVCPDLFHSRRWDVGSNGYGIWLNGGGVEIVGNVLAGQASAGAAIWARPLNYKLTNADTVLFPTALLRPHHVPDWHAGRRHEEMIPIDIVPGIVRDNVVYVTGVERYANNAGFLLSYHLYRQPERHPEGPRTEFAGNLAWNVRHGLVGRYLSWVHIRDSTFIAGTTVRRGGVGLALRYKTNGGHVVENVRVEGFPECVRAPEDPATPSVFRGVACDGRSYVRDSLSEDGSGQAGVSQE